MKTNTQSNHSLKTSTSGQVDTGQSVSLCLLFTSTITGPSRMSWHMEWNHLFHNVNSVIQCDLWDLFLYFHGSIWSPSIIDGPFGSLCFTLFVSVCFATQERGAGTIEKIEQIWQSWPMFLLRKLMERPRTEAACEIESRKFSHSNGQIFDGKERGTRKESDIQ